MKVLAGVLNAIKWFTQRLTKLIYWPMVVVLVPYVLAMIVQVTGLWSFIDNLYLTTAWLFWTLMAITRLIYFAACYFAGHYIWKYGLKWEFFWTKPEEDNYSRHESYDRDNSVWLIAYALITAIVFCVAEIAIRFSTGTMPPYLPG